MYEERVCVGVNGTFACQVRAKVPPPDAMARLSILGPVAQVVAMYAALRTAADTGVATGEGRTHGQLMADTAICAACRPVVQPVLDLRPREIAARGVVPARGPARSARPWS